MISPIPCADGDTLAPMLRKLEYNGQFDAADRKALLNLPFTVKRVERAQFIVRDGQIAANSIVLLEGTAVRSKVVATGHRQILSIHIRGELWSTSRIRCCWSPTTASRC